jgi:hypothetical protein
VAGQVVRLLAMEPPSTIDSTQPNPAAATDGEACFEVDTPLSDPDAAVLKETDALLADLSAAVTEGDGATAAAMMKRLGDAQLTALLAPSPAFEAAIRGVFGRCVAFNCGS